MPLGDVSLYLSCEVSTEPATTAIERTSAAQPPAIATYFREPCMRSSCVQSGTAAALDQVRATPGNQTMVSAAMRRSPRYHRSIHPHPWCFSRASPWDPPSFRVIRMNAPGPAVPPGARAPPASSRYASGAFWERLWGTGGIQFIGCAVIAYAIYGAQPGI